MATTKTKTLRKRATPSVSIHGEMDLLYAKDMRVLTRIQRVPTQSRLRSLADDWDEAKVGMIFVARITDGPDAGTLHAYDGGTRVLAQQEFGDPEYVFTAWVRDMTEEEAAKAFLAFNMLSRRPSAYAQYSVALEANEEWAHAILRATTAVGITVAESTSANKLSAVKACERIVTNRAHPSATAASDHLVEVFGVTMAAYPTTHEAYDADLIQAVSRILLDNVSVPVDKTRLAEKIGGKSMGRWRTSAQSARGLAAGTSGGSESRSLMLRRELITEYNKRLAAAKKLV